MKKALCLALVFVLCNVAIAKDYVKAPPVKGPIKPPTAAWTAKIEQLAPAKPTAEPKAPRRVLLFSLTTGYYHTVIPHTDVVIKVLADKTGAFQIVQTDDIEMFSPEKLKDFDAVILNNTCSINTGRNLFLDVLRGAGRAGKLGAKYKDLTDEQREAKAAELEQSLLDFVASGKGLICLHGGISLVNSSPKFGEMLGGSFGFHPALQQVTLDLVEPNHPLLAGFEGKGLIHVDEPYMFTGDYARKNFRPLLRMDVTKLDKRSRSDRKITGEVRYVAWIKPYGKGRVFYSGPGHQPETFETTAMLRFLLDGMQYALGDLPCDDSVKKGAGGAGREAGE